MKHVFWVVVYHFWVSSDILSLLIVFSCPCIFFLGLLFYLAYNIKDSMLKTTYINSKNITLNKNVLNRDLQQLYCPAYSRFPITYLFLLLPTVCVCKETCAEAIAESGLLKDRSTCHRHQQQQQQQQQSNSNNSNIRNIKRIALQGPI